ncbi:hypothetical protein [Pseudomonas sp. KNUC1026]|uniref:hypothetical protein n=1 Tax=Pseudomonas sp. KNUC1026 TaxID=2893890 RepID=UPI001F3DD2CA|nr:hypothetical protein [Pseudomonas sp. KNUC1026]UFH50505.1 hypothetical protein LN139_04485 [Pseudomonas sp. KNUC1026]
MADAVQYAIASARTESQGDNSASTYYRYAAIASGFSAFAFIYAAFWTALALSVFIAGTIVMLLAYALSKKAKNLESTPIENWVKNSCWGLPASQRRWLKSDQADNAVNALNIALIGISADISIRFHAITGAAASSEAVNPIFRDNASIPMGAWLDYDITLPQYEISRSSYTFTIFSSDESHPKKIPIASGVAKGELKIINPDIFADILSDTSKSFVERYDTERIF